MKQITKRKQAGFSLIELLIVLLVICVIASIAVINSRETSSLLSGKLDLTRLQQVLGAQDDYRNGYGTRSFGTLYELSRRSTPRGKLLPDTVVTFSGQTPQPVDGWLIQDNPRSPPTTNSLVSGFSVVMMRPDASGADEIFCIHEDGEIRRSTFSRGCTRTSEIVK